MIKSRRTFPSLRLTAIATLCLSLAGVTAAHAGARAYALAGSALLPFDLDHPESVGTPIPISGLIVGDTLVGIDFRPINGHLYGLADASGGVLRLYHISFRTGTATAIGPTGSFVADDGITPAPVRGTRFGIDFDPVADRLRVVNDAGQNFLIDPNNGAFVDSNPNAPGVNMDPPMEGQPVDGAAYTNNRQVATGTTLYTLSPTNDMLYVRSAANTSAWTYAIPVLLHGDRLDFAAVPGFDILPGIDASASGVIAVGKGYALLTVAPGGGPDSGTELYAIDLTTGVIELVGFLGDDETTPVRGLAVQGEEVPGGLPAMVVTATFGPFPNVLARFNTGASVTEAGSAIITGLRISETVLAIDWRPQTGQLFAATAFPQYVNDQPGEYLVAVRQLDPRTGVAGPLVASYGDLGIVTPQSAIGADFDPTTDRVRIVLDNGTYAVLGFGNPGFHADGTITGLPPGSTGVTAAAYTNSFGQPLDGTGAATLYTLDAESDRLFIESPTSAGTQTQGIPVTRNGFPFTLNPPFHFTKVNGFDIPASVRVATSGAPATGRAYAVLTRDGETGGELYAIDLSSGFATQLNSRVLFPMTGLALGDGPPALTSVTLSSSPSQLAANEPVTFTATVVPATAAGTIAFTMNGTAITGCQAQPIAAGKATCTATLATSGTMAIAAVYSSDEFHLPATGILSQPVSPLATTTAATAGLTYAVTGGVVTFTAAVSPAAATGTVTFFVDGVSAGAASITDGQATLSADNVSAGVHQITAAYSGDPTFAPSTSAPSVLTIATPGPLTQYFAEGAGGFFRTQIGILNASATSAAHVSVWLYPEGGAPVELTMRLAPLARQTLDLDTVVDHEAGVSALVSSDQPVAATRQMTWGDPVYGSTLESGIPSTSPTWYFAEGATDPFSLYYLLQNPGATDAIVTLTHLLEGGAAPVAHQVIVPPFSRRTVLVNDVPGLAHASLSTHIAANVPIVAERAMYLNGTPRFWEGGAASRGATALSPTWSFAEGATGFFRTYLLLGNPNVDAAAVTVRYQLPDGATITKTYDMAGQSRRTIDVNAEDPQLASTPVGMTVTATQPIVSERAMWWGLPTWNEGSAALGSTETGYVWGIGEGAEAGPANESTFVLVTNASTTAGTVHFTVSYDDGTQQEKDYALEGDARLTVRIGDDFANARGRRFSVVVESLTDGMPISVDVSRYQSADGFLSAGGAASATKIVR